MMSFRLQEDVAQPVEQLTFNERVVGSIPTVLTCFSGFFIFRCYTEECTQIQGYSSETPIWQASHVRYMS